MSDSPTNLALSRSDLETVTSALAARFPTKVAEDQRTAHMHELLSSSASLGRALTAYTQHGLVHCRGTRGCTDLEADAAGLFEALSGWCGCVQEIAALYPVPDFGPPSRRELHSELEPRLDYAR